MEAFEVEIEKWYNHPEGMISFKITYFEISGLSPYWLECRFTEDQQKVNPQYGGSLKESILTNYNQFSGVSYMNSYFIDLRSPNKWVPVCYSGKVMPFYLSRNERTVLGSWANLEDMQEANKKEWKF